MKNLKKIMLSAAVLAFAGMSSVNAATNSVPVSSSIVFNIQDKTPVKAGDLPDAVKTTLSGEQYAGWTIKEAFSVQPADETPYFEVTLEKDDETQVVNLSEAGEVVELPVASPMMPMEEPSPSTPSEEPTPNEEPIPSQPEPTEVPAQ